MSTKKPSELKAMIRKLADCLSSMPDAGLTVDDPRSKWYADSKQLRDEAYAMIGEQRNTQQKPSSEIPKVRRVYDSALRCPRAPAGYYCILTWGHWYRNEPDCVLEKK